MIKREELTNPKSCMSRAKPDEMTFVLLARDITAPGTIRDWCQRRINCGKNTPGDPQIQEAIKCAEEMERQQRGAQSSPDRLQSARGAIKLILGRHAGIPWEKMTESEVDAYIAEFERISGAQSSGTGEETK